MATATMKAPAPGGLSNKARELMEEINTEAGKHNVWIRTQANAPAQRVRGHRSVTSPLRFLTIAGRLFKRSSYS